MIQVAKLYSMCQERLQWTGPLGVRVNCPKRLCLKVISAIVTPINCFKYTIYRHHILVILITVFYSCYTQTI